MQQPKESQPPEAYLSWQDLLDEDTPSGSPGIALEHAPAAEPPRAAAPQQEQMHAPAGVKLPADVQALLTDKERLEDELAHLTGHAPRPQDERLRRMYPVRVHTKETRIEERRLRRHDEHQRMLKQRVLQVKLTRGRQEQRAAEWAAERKRRSLEAARGLQRAEEQRLELEELRRRQAGARLQAAARAQEAAAEAAADRERRDREQALVQARWARARQKALQARARQRRSDAADQVPDAGKRRPEMGTEIQPAPEARPGRQEASRWDEARARLVERKRAAAAWEEERERQRAAAAAGRKADEAVMARLDRRGANGRD